MEADPEAELWQGQYGDFTVSSQASVSDPDEENSFLLPQPDS